MKNLKFEVKGYDVEEFSFQVSEALPDFVPPWLSVWLSRYIGDGAQIRDGQTLQFGFWYLLCEVRDRKLFLMAPVPGVTPVEWSNDLTPVFQSMMAHKFLPESFGLAIDVPRLNDTATVGQFFNEFPMFMNRTEKVDNGVDSGWFIGSTRHDVDNSDPDQLAVISLHEASVLAPWIHDFLSLPESFQVVFESQAPVVLRKFEPVQPLPDSYFVRRYSKE